MNNSKEFKDDAIEAIDTLRKASLSMMNDLFGF